MLFPTSFKAKISKQLSFPVGAELISSGLSDVPQAHSLKIDFVGYYNTMLVDKPFEILSVSYSPSAPFEGWRVSVSPVPRESKHIVRETLRAEFFPRIRQWLIARADLSGGYGGDSCGVIFDQGRWYWRQRFSAGERFSTVEVNPVNLHSQ